MSAASMAASRRVVEAMAAAGPPGVEEYALTLPQLARHDRRRTDRAGNWRSWVALETFALSLRSELRPPRDDGQIGTSLGGAGALHNVERCDRTAKTPQLQVSEVFEPCDRFDRASDAAADQDLPVLCRITKPGGEVAYRTNCSVAGAIGKPDLAEGCIALRNADAETKLAAVTVPSSDQLARRLAHRHCHLDRALGRVGTGHGIVEEHHDPVAREMVERAFKLVHQRTQAAVVFSQEVELVLRLRGLGEGGVSAQIAEHDNDLTTMAFEDFLVAVRDNQFGKLRCKEPLQPTVPP